jgi:hypothetical protein
MAGVVDKKKRARPPRVMTTTFNMRLSPEEHRRWKAAAKRAGLKLAAWVRSILDVAAADGDEELLLFARSPTSAGQGEANR